MRLHLARYFHPVYVLSAIKNGKGRSMSAALDTAYGRDEQMPSDNSVPFIYVLGLALACWGALLGGATVALG